MDNADGGHQGTYLQHTYHQNTYPQDQYQPQNTFHPPGAPFSTIHPPSVMEGYVSMSQRQNTGEKPFEANVEDDLLTVETGPPQDLYRAYQQQYQETPQQWQVPPQQSVPTFHLADNESNSRPRAQQPRGPVAPRLSPFSISDDGVTRFERMSSDAKETLKRAKNFHGTFPQDVNQRRFVPAQEGVFRSAIPPQIHGRVVQFQPQPQSQPLQAPGQSLNPNATSFVPQAIHHSQPHLYALEIPVNNFAQEQSTFLPQATQQTPLYQHAPDSHGDDPSRSQSRLASSASQHNATSSGSSAPQPSAQTPNKVAGNNPGLSADGVAHEDEGLLINLAQDTSEPNPCPGAAYGHTSNPYRYVDELAQEEEGLLPVKTHAPQPRPAPAKPPASKRQKPKVAAPLRVADDAHPHPPTQPPQHWTTASVLGQIPRYRGVPPGTTLEEICSRYPNTLVGEGLDPFLQWRWSYIDVYNAVSAEVKDRWLREGVVHSETRDPRMFMCNRLRFRRDQHIKADTLGALLEAPKLFPCVGGYKKGLRNLDKFLKEGPKGVNRRRKRENVDDTDEDGASPTQSEPRTAPSDETSEEVSVPIAPAAKRQRRNGQLEAVRGQPRNQPATSDQLSFQTPGTQATSVETPIVEATSVEATSVEATSVEATNVEATSVEATSVEATSVEATSVEATSVEATSVEATSVEATSVEATSVEATSVEAPVIEAQVDFPPEAPELKIPKVYDSQVTVLPTKTRPCGLFYRLPFWVDENHFNLQVEKMLAMLQKYKSVVDELSETDPDFAQADEITKVDRRLALFGFGKGERDSFIAALRLADGNFETVMNQELPKMVASKMKIESYRYLTTDTVGKKVYADIEKGVMDENILRRVRNGALRGMDVQWKQARTIINHKWQTLIQSELPINATPQMDSPVIVQNIAPSVKRRREDEDSPSAKRGRIENESTSSEETALDVSEHGHLSNISGNNNLREPEATSEAAENLTDPVVATLSTGVDDLRAQPQDPYLPIVTDPEGLGPVDSSHAEILLSETNIAGESNQELDSLEFGGFPLYDFSQGVENASAQLGGGTEEFWDKIFAGNW